MNRNPYEVLEISPNASDEEIREAYRALARRYSSGDYLNGPLADVAQSKMQEIDAAYDAIILGRRGQSQTESYSSEPYRTSNQGYSQFEDVRSAIAQGALENAETILDGIPKSMRSAEWYFLKGNIQYRRGWFEDAYRNYTTAYQMNPNNSEYASAYHNINRSRQGQYRTNNSNRSGCSGCEICTGLLCADCCCECMGEDLIPCC